MRRSPPFRSDINTATEFGARQNQVSEPDIDTEVLVGRKMSNEAGQLGLRACYEVSHRTNPVHKRALHELGITVTYGVSIGPGPGPMVRR